MPSTNRSRSSGRASIRWRRRAARRRTRRSRRQHALAQLAHPAAQVVGLERQHLGAEAVEEGGVAGLVRRAGWPGRSRPRRSAPRAGTARGRRSRAPRRSRTSRATRSGSPAPRPAWPASARGRPRSRARAPSSSGAPRARRARRSRAARPAPIAASGCEPQVPSAVGLHHALALLALELRVVAALRAVDPAAEQRDRVQLARRPRRAGRASPTLGDSSPATSRR